MGNPDDTQSEQTPPVQGGSRRPRRKDAASTKALADAARAFDDLPNAAARAHAFQHLHAILWDGEGEGPATVAVRVAGVLEALAASDRRPILDYLKAAYAPEFRLEGE